MKPYEARYQCYIGKLLESDTCEFILSDTGSIKVEPYTERWRSPEDAVKYYEGIAKVIRKEFIKW